MALPEAFLQELRYRCDIESVVSRYVNLRKSGRNLVGLCPFHNEKTPSFNVYTDDQHFFCFGCEVGGDVITFIRKIENLDYLEAVKLLAQQAGMQMPEEGDDGSLKLKQRQLEMHREAARFYHQCLISPQGKRGLDYFSKRRLSMATVKGFGLGFAPENGYVLLNHLKGLGFHEEEIYAASLALKSKSGRYYDRFRDRVMFPIIDLRGNVVAFGGRVLDDSLPKYLNSSETPIFKKHNNLFALNFAKNGNNTAIILCEGYMDVIALHQAGFKNAVASLGTALTPEQCRLIARYCKEVIISYDSDAAGQRAAQRAIGMLNEAGLTVRVLKIEGGKDPDEFIKTYGADKFRLMLEKSGSHIDYRLANAKTKYNLDTADQLAAYLKEASAILATLTSSIEREVYAGKLSEELSVSKESILDDISRILKSSRKADHRRHIKQQLDETHGVKDRINPEKSRYLRAARAEENLILILYHNPDYLSKLNQMISSDDFVTAFNKKVYAAVSSQIADQGEANLAALGESFTTEEISKLTSLLITRQVSNTIEEAQDCVNVIFQEKQSQQLSNPNQEADMLELFENLKKKKLDAKKKTGGSLT